MLALALLSFTTLALTPGDTIRVGDPALVGMLITGVEKMDNYIMIGEDKRLTITFIQSISKVPEGFQIVEENRRRDGAAFSIDTIVVTEGSLATVWHADQTPMGSKHVVFSKGRMTGVETDTLNEQKPIDAEVPHGLFDYSIMTLIADRLPLAVGYKATIATYDITRGEIYVPIEVVGTETVDIDGSKYDTWKMEVSVGGQKVSRWIARDTRKEVKWSVTFNGRHMIGLRHSEERK